MMMMTRVLCFFLTTGVFSKAPIGLIKRTQFVRREIAPRSQANFLFKWKASCAEQTLSREVFESEKYYPSVNGTKDSSVRVLHYHVSIKGTCAESRGLVKARQLKIPSSTKTTHLYLIFPQSIFLDKESVNTNM